MNQAIDQLMKRGIVAHQRGDLLEAEKMYRRVLQLEVSHYDASLNLGKIAISQNEFESASAFFASAAKSDPNRQESYYYSGICYQRLGDFELAVGNYCNAIALQPNYTEAHNNLGICYKNLGHLDKAEASFRSALSYNENYPRAYINLGNLLQDTGNLEEAVWCYKSGIKLLPEYPLAYNNLGNALKALARLDEAEEAFRQGIRLDPTNSNIYVNLTNTLRALNELNDAMSVSQQAVHINPDQATNYISLGNVFLDLKNLEKAEDNFNAAATLEPNNTEAADQLGWVFLLSDRPLEAEKSFRRAIALNPNWSIPYKHLGILLHSTGNLASSISYLKKAKELDPNSHELQFELAFLTAKLQFKGNDQDLSTQNVCNLVVGKNTTPIILDRAVEPGLTQIITKMASRNLDVTADARFGAGRCSLDFNFFAHNEPPLDRVFNDLTESMKSAVGSDILICDSFFNVLGAGGGTTPHNHIAEHDSDYYLRSAKQKYSLVYYLSVGDQNRSEPGILKLYDPHDEILPREGMIVIIPADRYHSAVYDGRTDRIMIGVNFYSLKFDKVT